MCFSAFDLGAGVDRRSQPLNRLPEAHWIRRRGVGRRCGRRAEHRRLQLGEGDAEILRHVNGRDELALVLEAGGRGVERQTEAEARRFLRACNGT